MVTNDITSGGVTFGTSFGTLCEQMNERKHKFGNDQNGINLSYTSKSAHIDICLYEVYCVS